MSLKNLTWDQLVLRLNSGKTYGSPISIELLRKICERGELTEASVHFLLEVYLRDHSAHEKLTLLKSLIRNSHLTLDSKIEALTFLFFKMHPMKESDSKKKSLALEVLNLCKDSSQHRLKVLAMIEEIKLKELSRLANRDERKTLNVLSLESSVLQGISTRDYSKYELESARSIETKELNSRKMQERAKVTEDLTWDQLLDFFKSNSAKSRTLRASISSRLNEPWGADLESIIWMLKNLGDFDTDRLKIDSKLVNNFIIKYFECQRFVSRLTTKTLLTNGLNSTDFPLWRKDYGRPFLLSDRKFVPGKFRETYNVFQDFINKLNPAELFVRKTFGLSYKLVDRQVNSFVYYLKTPNLKKRNAGKFLIVVFFDKKIPKRLVKFLGLQEIQTYLKTHMKSGDTWKLKIPNCYVKECKNADSTFEILALLQLEVPIQFLGSSYEALNQVEVFYPAPELLKRKQFLDFLSRKKIAISRARSRESDIHCINCNQPLTDKLSRIRGYGPDCWRKLKHLNITAIDLSSTSDVFERYAVQDFEGWLRLVRAVVQDLT